MKTITLFLALATALFGQAPASYDNQPKVDWSQVTSMDAKNLIISSGTKADVEIIAKYDILLSADNAAGKLLSVNGIKQIVPVPLTGNHNIWLTRQKAPDRPDEITVHLWTADGKKWVARWEEVKK